MRDSLKKTNSIHGCMLVLLATLIPLQVRGRVWENACIHSVHMAYWATNDIMKCHIGFSKFIGTWICIAIAATSKMHSWILIHNFHHKKLHVHHMLIISVCNQKKT